MSNYAKIYSSLKGCFSFDVADLCGIFIFRLFLWYLFLFQRLFHVKFYYKKDIAKNLNFYTRVELFYDYRKPGLLDWQTLDDQLAAGTISQAKYDEMNDRGWLGKRAFETDFDWELALTYHFSSWLAANFSVNMKYDTDFSGMGRLGRWQMYQSAGVQIYFNWKHDQQH